MLYVAEVGTHVDGSEWWINYFTGSSDVPNGRQTECAPSPNVRGRQLTPSKPKNGFYCPQNSHRSLQTLPKLQNPPVRVALSGGHREVRGFARIFWPHRLKRTVHLRKLCIFKWDFGLNWSECKIITKYKRIFAVFRISRTRTTISPLLQVAVYYVSQWNRL